MDRKTFELALYEGINESWDDFLQCEKNKTYYHELIDNLYNEIISKEIYPSVDKIFRVFKDMSLGMVKVIIIGQDPYHTPGVADGLAFSSQASKIPPSLRNIFKEINNDLGYVNDNPDLSNWSKQGVMLLNTSLSVEKGKANSHKKLGWNQLITNLIKYIDNNKKIVFILWGEHAKSFKPLISNGFVIEGYHPSPFTGKKFFDQHYFSRTNDYLKQLNLNEIDWRS